MLATPSQATPRTEARMDKPSLYAVDANRLQRAMHEAQALVVKAIRNGGRPKPRLARQALRIADECAAALDRQQYRAQVEYINARVVA